MYFDIGRGETVKFWCFRCVDAGAVTSSSLAGGDGFATGGLSGWRGGSVKETAAAVGLRQSHLQKWQLATGYSELPRPSYTGSTTLP